MGMMKNRIKVGLDAYGVVLDPLAKLYALMEVVGHNIAPYHFNGRQSMIDLGYTSQQYDKALRRLYETDSFFSHSNLMPGAERHIKQLREIHNLELVVISSCRGLTEERLVRLCRKYDLPISALKVNVEDKTAAYSDCDYVIDDELRHLSPLPSSVVPILMLPIERGVQTSPTPAPLDLDPRIRKARGWTEVSDHIHELALAA
jgi:5'(3')-deoxyribonucleotidase